MPFAFPAAAFALALGLVASVAGPAPAPKPEPLVPLERLVSPDDYPADALKSLQEGTVRIRIEVDRTGAVSDCVIEQSSGVAALDAQTCRLIWLRARFKPATDSSGSPVPSRIEKTYVWQLEQGEPAPSEAWAIRKINRIAPGRPPECRVEFEGAIRDRPDLPECEASDIARMPTQPASAETAVELVEEHRFAVGQEPALRMAPGDRLVGSQLVRLEIDASGNLTECKVSDTKGYIPPDFAGGCAIAGKRFVPRRGPGGGLARFTAYLVVGAYLHFERVT